MTRQQHVDNDDSSVVIGAQGVSCTPSDTCSTGDVKELDRADPSDLVVSDINMDATERRSKPRPKPRMSLMKKGSSEDVVDVVDIKEDLVDMKDDVNEMTEDFVNTYQHNRSDSTMSTDSTRSLTRAYSYQSAVDGFTEESIEDENSTSKSIKHEESGSKSRKNVVPSVPVSGDGGNDEGVTLGAVPFQQITSAGVTKKPETCGPKSHQVISEAGGQSHQISASIIAKEFERRKDCVKLAGGITPVHHPKKIPPPLPTKGPVGVMRVSRNTQSPVGSSRESSPQSHTHLRVQDIDRRKSPSPPCTPPKPSKQTIEQAKHSLLEPVGMQEGSKAQGVSMSISTPNISQHQEVCADTVTLRKSNRSKHHKSSVDIKDKQQSPTGGIQQFVRALSKVGSDSTGMDEAEHGDDNRRHSSLFYYNLDGEVQESHTKKESRRWSFGAGSKKTDKKEKKRKQSEANSVFYCGVNEGGTLKFEEAKSVIDSKERHDHDDGTLTHQAKDKPIVNVNVFKDDKNAEKLKKRGKKSQQKALNPRNVLAQYVNIEYHKQKKADIVPTLPPKISAPKSFDEVLLPVSSIRSDNIGSGSDGSHSPVAPPRNKRKSRSKNRSDAPPMSVSKREIDDEEIEYAEIGDVSDDGLISAPVLQYAEIGDVSDDGLISAPVLPPDLPPRPDDLIRASRIRGDSEEDTDDDSDVYETPDETDLYETPPEPIDELPPKAASEHDDDDYFSSDSFDSAPEEQDTAQGTMYVNNDGARRQLSKDQGVKFHEAVHPTIVIRSSSDDNQLTNETENNNADGRKPLQSMPSMEELKTIYMPMSTSVPGGLRHSDSVPVPGSKRFSDISISSTTSDDYIPMTPHTLDLLGINLRQDISHGLRPSSWAGPETEDAMKEGTMMPLNISQSTTDSDASEDSEGEFNLGDIMKSLKDMKVIMSYFACFMFYMKFQHMFLAISALLN